MEICNRPFPVGMRIEPGEFGELDDYLTVRRDLKREVLLFPKQAVWWRNIAATGMRMCRRGEEWTERETNQRVLSEGYFAPGCPFSGSGL